jgi:hypothetical protein
MALVVRVKTRTEDEVVFHVRDEFEARVWRVLADSVGVPLSDLMLQGGRSAADTTTATRRPRGRRRVTAGDEEGDGDRRDEGMNIAPAHLRAARTRAENVGADTQARQLAVFIFEGELIGHPVLPRSQMMAVLRELGENDVRSPTRTIVSNAKATGLIAEDTATGGLRLTDRGRDYCQNGRRRRRPNGEGAPRTDY